MADALDAIVAGGDATEILNGLAGHDLRGGPLGGLAIALALISSSPETLSAQGVEKGAAKGAMVIGVLTALGNLMKDVSEAYKNYQEGRE